MMTLALILLALPALAYVAAAVVWWFLLRQEGMRP